MNSRKDGYLGEEWVRIQQVTYNIDEHHKQSFAIPFYPHYTNTGVKQFVVRAVSNHGAKDHTCFYRVIMHGSLAEEIRFD